MELYFIGWNKMVLLQARSQKLLPMLSPVSCLQSRGKLGKDLIVTSDVTMQPLHTKAQELPHALQPWYQDTVLVTVTVQRLVPLSRRDHTTCTATTPSWDYRD